MRAPACELLAVVLALAAAGAAGAEGGAPAALEVRVAAAVSVAAPVPAAVVGFSAEYRQAPWLAASPGFVQMMRNLRALDGVRGPNLRVGGNSADLTWWDPTGERDKGRSCGASYSGAVCVRYALNASDVEALAAAAEAVDGDLVLGVSMVQNGTAQWAREEALGALRAAPRGLVVALEVGNEPDLYGEHGIRDPGYSAAAYMAEMQRYYLPVLAAAAAEGGTKGAPLLQGGTLCCKVPFTSHAQGIARALRSSGALKTWSQHGYGLAVQQVTPTVAALLSSDAVTSRIEHYLRPAAEVAAGAGVPFVVGETNSVNMGGRANVSDTFASALWAFDWTARLVKLNATRVNFHGSDGCPYSWLGGFADTSRRAPLVRPLYYAMAVLTQALRGGPTPVAATVAAAGGGATPEDVVAHAWALPHGGVRVAVVNKRLAKRGAAPLPVLVKVQPSGSGDAATAMWLTAPDAHAKVGLAWGSSLGTLTFDGTSDGTPVGKAVPQPLATAPGGGYLLLSPPCSVALLEVARHGHGASVSA